MSEIPNDYFIILQEHEDEIGLIENDLLQKQRMLEALNPEKILRQGYAIVSGDLKVGGVVKITTFEAEAEAEIRKIREEKKW